MNKTRKQPTTCAWLHLAFLSNYWEFQEVLLPIEKECISLSVHLPSRDYLASVRTVTFLDYDLLWFFFFPADNASQVYVCFLLNVVIT